MLSVESKQFFPFQVSGAQIHPSISDEYCPLDTGSSVRSGAPYLLSQKLLPCKVHCHQPTQTVKT